MLDKLKMFFDVTFWKFILVGIANTLFGAAIMFIFYNLLQFNYWISSVSNYVFGSILSYFLNKNFTFKNKNKDKKILCKFVVNILICYLMAYGCARPAVHFILSKYPESIQDNVAMLVGMVVFVGLNYIGQRFWAFKKDSEE